MKRALFLMIGCLIGLVMIANPITKEEAQQKAVQFLSKKQSNRALAPRLKPVSLQEVSGLNSERLYAFNVGQKNGFVVMSADDCTGELILGYADKGELSEEKMPDNMRAWLKGYDDEIKWMQEHGVTNQVAASRAMTASAARTPISPLLTSRWNQDVPYNTYCPQVGVDPVPTVTGCVATATAQVLYYYGKKGGTPTTTLKAIPGYTTLAYSCAVGEKAVRTFNWSKMKDIYPSDAAANEEVARLMEYVGAGLKMDYRPANVGGSSAYQPDIPYVLTEYFGYDKSARCVFRNDYSYGEWIDMMYEMLSNGDPVLYGGDSTGGGHAFVLDGYTEDDYFHVNWGWGGESDGHFKLSVLYSEEQGIGGSTSQNGYSAAQEAIINVNPVNSGVDTSTRMTATDAFPDQTKYNRYSASEDFTNVDFTNVRLHFGAYNYTGATVTFDFGWGLYRGNELLSVLLDTNTNTTYEIPNRAGFPSACLNTHFGAGLEDGDYLLMPISKKHDTETWYPDFGSEVYYINATISGNTLTLAESVQMAMSVTSVSVSANPEVGKPVTITAKLHNDGTLYSGDVSIGTATGGTPAYKLLASQQIEVDAEKEIDVTFTFTPSDAGGMTIYLLNKSQNAISESPINITVSPSNATTGTLAINWENDITFDNAVSADSKQWYSGFYGSKILGHVTVTNSSTTNAHTSGLLIRLWKHNGVDYSFWDSHTCATNIAAKGGTQTFDFVFDELEVGTSYLVTYHYTNPETTEISVPHYPLNAQYGVTTIAADGTETTEAPKASVTTPAEALALDVSHLAIVTTVTPNSNPNTVYIVGNSVPSGLDGKNVVQNGTAATLTLQDGYGFYTPMAFTATNVTYTRTFTTGADGTNGWSTIVLPFDVAQVKQGDKVIDWFHNSSDTGKHFWVKNFSSEDGSTVNFDFVDQMKADTPYIIAVPGSTWGESWNLTDKPITFYGANATIESGTLASVSGNQYKFAGTKQAKSVTDCYVMNDKGNAFSKTSTTVAPFRAYFSPLTMMAGQPAAAALYIGSEGNNPTGITEMTYDRQETKGAAYNLNGQRVAHPRKGLYIVDGKKVIMK